MLAEFGEKGRLYAGGTELFARDEA